MDRVSTIMGHKESFPNDARQVVLVWYWFTLPISSEFIHRHFANNYTIASTPVKLLWRIWEN